MDISLQMASQQFQEIQQEEQDFAKQLSNKQKVSDSARALKKTLGEAAIAMKTGKKVGDGSKQTEHQPMSAGLAFVMAVSQQMDGKLKDMAIQAENMTNLNPQITNATNQLNSLVEQQGQISQLDPSQILAAQAELGAKMGVLNTDISSFGIKASQYGTALSSDSSVNSATQANAEKLVNTVIAKQGDYSKG